MGVQFGKLPKGMEPDSAGFGRETEAGTVHVVVREGRSGNSLAMVVGHQAEQYGFTLERFSAEDRAWIVEVVSNQIARAYRQGFKEGTDYVREPIKAALGIRS